MNKRQAEKDSNNQTEIKMSNNVNLQKFNNETENERINRFKTLW